VASANPGVAPLNAATDAGTVKSAKSTAAKKAKSVVVAPATKRASDPREYPAARDARGTANRTEIRRESPRVAAPRASNRTAERGNQPRSHAPGKL
jgi:hypothetical protein